MAIAEDLPQFERLLRDLITRYEQYFIGLEKREPLQLTCEVEQMVRRYANTPINNTMYKYKYNTLVARFNTYREHWNRVLRLIEEGNYSRDRFIRDLHQRHKTKHSHGEHDHQHDVADSSRDEAAKPDYEIDLNRIFKEFCEARKACNLPMDNISLDVIADTIKKSKPSLAARLGTEDLIFRVVIENGKPKIKASLRK
jgi:hypothetical protein